MKRKFITSINYNNRQEKANYVVDKYKEILSKGRVLDVGADSMHLKPLLSPLGVDYVGIGYGKGIDQSVNLETVPFPFDRDSFDVVLCLDVLEHLENIHEVFDELCRISKIYIIISLPNPAAIAFNMFFKGDYSSDVSMKFYGLPNDKPNDRHRWFFTEKESINFITKRAEMNGFSVVQIDSRGDDSPLGGKGIKGYVIRKLMKLVFRNDIEDLGLNHGTTWFVLCNK
jgi:SAM-dependent methyltransferase